MSSPFAIMAEELDQNREHGLSVQTETDDFYLQGRPCELSSFSFVPTSRCHPADRTVFNSRKPVSLKLKVAKLRLFTLVTQENCTTFHRIELHTEVIIAHSQGK